MTPAPDLAAVRVLLCDADGCLFPSEEPAFVASTEVTNRALGELGIERRFTPAELQAFAVGKNFRSTVSTLAAEHGVPIADAEALERWVAEERRAVVAHLAEVLAPDPAVLEPLTRLGGRFGLAVVSSSARARLAACFAATGLDGLFGDAVFSAEDSLPVPTSKPDPAVYVFAGRALGVAGPEGLAIEDSVTGTRSAVGAGFPTVGNVAFVPEDEREQRTADLVAAGAGAVVASWAELEGLLAAAPERLRA